jgi:hypothetical protein
MSRYGYAAKAPGDVVLRRSNVVRSERQLGEKFAAYGIAEIEGDKWPSGDSGLVASWISGSEYVKVYTGIKVLFPKETYLYQGPLPNEILVRNQSFRVMSGLEFCEGRHLHVVNNREYGVATLNAVIQLPKPGEAVSIKRGDPLLCFYLVGRALELVHADEGL